MHVQNARTNTRHSAPALRSVSAIIAVAGVCFATASASLTDEPPLGGPKVQERNVPGVRGSFGEGGPGQRRMGDNLPPQAIRRAIESVIGPNAPEATRGTPEQIAKVNAIVQQHEQAVRDYMQQHREELAQLRRDSGGPRGGPEGDRPRRRPDGQGRPPADDMMGEPAAPSQAQEEARQAARERSREILAGAPKIEDAMTKVWAELSAEQRTAVDAQLDSVRERMSRERQDRYVDQRTRERGGPPADAEGRPGPGGPPGARPRGPGGPDGGPGARISPERRDRLMRIFEQMSPEEQDQLLQRLENRARDARESGGERPPAARRPGGPGPRDPQPERPNRRAPQPRP